LVTGLGNEPIGGVLYVLFVVALFGSVLIHELAHALGGFAL